MLGNRYSLGTLLGEGGMGIVYRATDTLLERDVAVKIFREGTAERSRTSSETQLLASLSHPALVTLFDAQIDGEDPRYLVMEFVDGPTLQSRLQSGPLTPQAVTRIARDLGEALHAVHHAGIVHRDIKPANVLLRPSSVPGEEFHAKLADFGIAHLVDSPRLTVPGTVIGSAAYLSPEQVTGTPPAPASDVYSLGLILIEALTGRRAFAQMGGPEAALARLTQDPVIPGWIGNEWGGILTDMTARDPEKRPTALDVVIRVADIGARVVPISSDATVGDGVARPAAASDDSEHEFHTFAVVDGLPAGEWATDAPTMVLPPESSATTRKPSAPARKRITWGMSALAAVVGAIAIVVVIVMWAPDGEAAPSPTLPAVEDPLGSHLDQLQQSVSP